MLSARAFVLSLAVIAAPAAMADDDFTKTPYSSAGDAKAGESVFRKCRACHNVVGDGPRRTGPHLFKIFGRKTAADDGYSRYSGALKEADLIWTEERLNAFITDPNDFIPGVQAGMRIQKVRTQKERNDLLAYLRSATEPQ